MKVFWFLMGICVFTAQDLRGKWVNMYANSDEIDQMNLNTFQNGIYAGDSYDTSYGGEFCKYTFRAKYDPSTKEFMGYDDELIDKTQNHRPVAYRLKYQKEGNKEYLEGYGRIINIDGSLDAPFRVRYFKEIDEEAQGKEISSEEVAIIKNYKKSRKNPQKAAIRLKSEKVKIKVHDYGKEDHDSISIIYNDELIAYKIPIDSQEKEFEFQLRPGQDNQLTFIAHNLGDVAPNTTYVEIWADNKVFKYTLFTNLQENAVINLRLQE